MDQTQVDEDQEYKTKRTEVVVSSDENSTKLSWLKILKAIECGLKRLLQ